MNNKAASGLLSDKLQFVDLVRQADKLKFVGQHNRYGHHSSGAQPGSRFHPMLRKTIPILLLIALLSGSLNARAMSRQSSEYGPEVKSFLDLMRHEEDELDFQIRHNEISRRDYNRSKTKIAIQRQTVLDLVKETGKDYVPDLYVVAASELDQLIEDGTSAIKGVKRGGLIGNKWRYIGSVHRGETFHILERLTAK